MRAVILTDPARLVAGGLRRVRVNGNSPRVGDAVLVLLGEQRLPGKIVQVYFARGLFYDVRLDGVEGSAPLPSASPPNIGNADACASSIQGEGVEQGRFV